jgi:DNA-binding ferritin-like protein
VCLLLNQQIIETIVLQLQAHKAAATARDHSSFGQLNSLFDGIVSDLTESTNAIVSRIHSLGGQECATIRLSAHQSHTRPPEIVDGREQLRSLLSGYMKYDFAARKIMKSIQELGDSETNALLSLIGVSIERNIWLLETYLQATAAGLDGRNLPQWTPAFENVFRSLHRNQRSCSHEI